MPPVRRSTNYQDRTTELLNDTDVNFDEKVQNMMTVTDTIKSLETMEVIETETSQKSIEMIAFGDNETRKNSKSMHENRPTMSFNHAKGMKVVGLNKISNHNDDNIPSPNDNFTKSVT